MLRLLGAIYAVAFLIAIHQIIPLIGVNGLLPVGTFLKHVTDSLGSPGAGFARLPSVFWFIHSDRALVITAWIGFLLSCVVVAGFANAPLLALLWFLYMSFVHVGQDWYGYGWEIQLLETGFLAIFLCPLIDMRPFPKRAPPMLVILLFRWMIFRIMLGAGLIKIRGDEVWRNGTALYYHFETQPIPGPMSRWFHFFPRAVLKTGVWFNFLAELAAPWFVFGPRIARHIAGFIIVVLQIILILSGNLSFLNWLTILPALACFDDSVLSKYLPRSLVCRAEMAATRAESSRPMLVTARILAVVIAILSIQPALNILSPGQIMNGSFDPFNLVNTYGAFGWVGRERLNVVYEGTMDTIPDENAHWKAYHYKGLPVDLNTKPTQIAPYQLRFDWQMWFAAMSSPEEYPWTLNLVSKLLHNDPGAVGLFADNPFPSSPPRWIRAVLYRYRFAKPDNPERRWWNRERIGDWLPALSVGDPRLTFPVSHSFISGLLPASGLFKRIDRIVHRPETIPGCICRGSRLRAAGRPRSTFPYLSSAGDHESSTLPPQITPPYPFHHSAGIYHLQYKTLHPCLHEKHLLQTHRRVHQSPRTGSGADQDVVGNSSCSTDYPHLATHIFPAAHRCKNRVPAAGCQVSSELLPSWRTTFQTPELTTFQWISSEKIHAFFTGGFLKLFISFQSLLVLSATFTIHSETDLQDEKIDDITDHFLR